MKYKILALGVMLLIFVSSSIPSEDFPHVEWWGWAKMIHLTYFGVLCFFFHHVLQEQKKYPLLARYPVLFAVLLTACYGMTDEVHQIFTPGRHALVSDVFVDTLGACLYGAGAKIVESIRLKRANAV
jgi:VanZ family protein